MNMIPLYEYVSQFIRLEKCNGSYWALCPFHNEKTPSFNISNEKYYCFGCKAGGGLLSFIIHYHNISYQEALHIVNDKKSYNDDNNILYVLHDWFQKSITYNEINYLALRGLTIDDIYKYKIGYVNSSITQYLSQMHYSVESILSTGLVYAKYSKLYDLLNDRIIFPIYNNGILVSFAGRSISLKPKYINGLETETFKKSNILHGYTFQHSKYILIVEGYTDVIALAKHNISSFATMGSLSLTQLLHIWKTCSCPIICLDGDEAGRKSTLRIIRNALPYLSYNKRLKFCIIDNDPDYMIHNNQFDLLMYKIRNAMTLTEYITYYDLINYITLEEIQDKYIKSALMKSFTSSKCKPTLIPFIKCGLQEQIILAALIVYSELLIDYSEEIASIVFQNDKVLHNILNKQSTEEIDCTVLTKYTITKDIAADIIISTAQFFRQNDYINKMHSKLHNDFSDDTWNSICNMHLSNK